MSTPYCVLIMAAQPSQAQPSKADHILALSMPSLLPPNTQSTDNNKKSWSSLFPSSAGDQSNCTLEFSSVHVQRVLCLL